MTLIEERLKRDSLLQDIEQITAATNHELRDGLREALLYCEEWRQLKGDVPPMLSRIEQCIERTLENVDALRQFSYLCQNVERPKAVRLEELLQRVRDQCSGLLTVNQGRILWEEPMEAVIWGRIRQLETLFIHLFDNALKYNDSAIPQVWVKVHDAGDVYHITVADNGIGMEEEYTFLIFGLFKRIEPRGAVKGCGVGLAIAKKVVENHGGTLTIQTAPDKGSRLSFALPKAESMQG